MYGHFVKSVNMFQPTHSVLIYAIKGFKSGMLYHLYKSHELFKKEYTFSISIWETIKSSITSLFKKSFIIASILNIGYALVMNFVYEKAAKSFDVTKRYPLLVHFVTKLIGYTVGLIVGDLIGERIVKKFTKRWWLTSEEQSDAQKLNERFVREYYGATGDDDSFTLKDYMVLCLYFILQHVGTIGALLRYKAKMAQVAKEDIEELKRSATSYDKLLASLDNELELFKETDPESIPVLLGFRNMLAKHGARLKGKKVTLLIDYPLVDFAGTFDIDDVVVFVFSGSAKDCNLNPKEWEGIWLHEMSHALTPNTAVFDILTSAVLYMLTILYFRRLKKASKDDVIVAMAVSAEFDTLNELFLAMSEEIVADSFATRMGLGNELKSGLRKIADYLKKEESGKSGFYKIVKRAIEIFYSPHPSFKRRERIITEIQKRLEQKVAKVA